MKRASLFLTAAAAALIAGSTLAAEYNEWDENADAAITEEEFGAGFGEEGIFDEWNTAADDEGLTEEEFGTGLFGEWDENEDAMIDETEFGEGYGAFGEQGDEAYTNWWGAAGEDEALDEEEFGTGFAESGIFDDWDENDSGFVENEEFTGGAFESADLDESGAIEEEEWEEDGWF